MKSVGVLTLSLILDSCCSCEVCDDYIPFKPDGKSIAFKVRFYSE